MNVRHVSVLLLVCIMTICGCSGPTVRTDFDPAANFLTFRTYAFGGLRDVNQAGVLDNSLLRKRLEQLVGQELSRKDLRQVGLDGHPDLIVHYWVGVKDKQIVQGTGPTMGAYGSPRGYGWGAAYGGVTTYEYSEGTLVVDLVTSTAKELVWRATLIGTLKDSTEDNVRMVKQGLAEAFAQYPPPGAHR